MGVVLAAEQQERQVQGEEEQEEGDVGAQRAQHQDGREDEPAREEEAHRRGRVPFIRPVFLQDGPGAGGQEEGVGDPEAAEGGEGGGAECVSNCHLPVLRFHNQFSTFFIELQKR